MAVCLSICLSVVSQARAPEAVRNGGGEGQIPSEVPEKFFNVLPHFFLVLLHSTLGGTAHAWVGTKICSQIVRQSAL